MIRRRSGQFTSFLTALLLSAGAGAAQPPPAPGAQPPAAADPAATEVTFRIFARGFPIGSETVTVLDEPDGWKVTTLGQIAAPISLTTRIAEVSYDRAWRPRSLFVDGIIKGQATTLKTAFSGTSAVSAIVQDTQNFTKTDTVSETTIVLPNLVFGLYEALAARLSTAKAGDTFSIYVVPQAEISMTVDAVGVERVSAPGRSFEARRHGVTFQNPGGPLKAEVWTDGARLMRVSIPSASLDVIRDDIASVATRQTTEYRVNDEDVRIPANGFNLAGTLSKPLPPADAAPAPAGPSAKPAAKPAALPAIVLVAGSGPVDRDESVAGIAIFAQLSAALADAGYAVLRYDKRGVGQSGGREEAATLADYTDDLVAAVKYLEKRKDIDRRRICVVGHSEGALVGLLAARREKRIAALVLVAAPGTTGAELVLEQQQHLLDRSTLSAEEKAAKVALQQRVHEAVLSAKGWDGVPDQVRKQAETPWFSSFLAFDPAAVVPRVKQPLLIVQPALDRQVPPHHADKLAALANGRKNAPATSVVTLPGVNHLLVPAVTGEVDEYGTLPTRTITPEAAAKIVEWLAAVRYS